MKKITILFSAFLLCFVMLSYGQWTYSDLSEAKAYMGATALGSKAYFAGGMNSSGLKSTVEIYDAVTGEWDTTQHLSVARDLPSATTCGNMVIFAGGVDFFSTGVAFSTVDIFDTQSQSWSVYNLSVPRFNVAAFSLGNKVFFVGGVDTQLGIAYDVIDIYDVETQQWTITSLDDVRVVYGGVVNDLVILPGGFVSSGVTKRVDIINFNGPSSIDSLSVARAWVGVTSVGNKMLIGGGAISGDIQSDTVDIYDALTGTWTAANLSLARSFADGQNAVTACGRAYFLGGGILNLNGPYWDAAYNVIDIYDPVTDSWSVDYLLHSYVHRAAVSVGDKILVAGGITMTGFYRSDVEIYTCPPSSCLPEGITFTTQEQIDNFQTNYPGCTEIEGEVSIGNYMGTDISNLNGLNVLTSIGGDLGIVNNDFLVSMNGLENLTSIGGHFWVQGNNNLIGFSGLENLNSIAGDLWILDNTTLISLTGLENIEASSIINLGIKNNPSLSTCDVQSICEYLSTPNGLIEIYSNAPGCNSQEEAEAACLTTIEELNIGNGITIIPNPSNDKITIDFPEMEAGINAMVSIFGSAGQEMISGMIVNCKSEIDVSSLAPGLYFIKVNNNENISFSRFIKN
jgi:hypothetical protein